MNPRAQRRLDEWSDEITASVNDFDAEASRAVRRAQIALLLWLAAVLTLRNGRIVQSAQNLRAIQQIPRRFDQLLGKYGFDAATGTFLLSLDRQFQAFRHMLTALGVTAVPHFSAEQQAYFAERRRDAAVDLLSIAQAIGSRAKFRALTTLGGSVEDLQGLVGKVLDLTGPQAKHYVATAIATYYRAIADVGYQELEAQQGREMRFSYAGPGSGDPVIRPFCQQLMHEVEVGASWTRAEIDAMRNREQTPVFICCGGSNCRHQWTPVL